MAKIRFNGSFSVRLSSLLTLARIGFQTYIRHAFGQRLEPNWDVQTETGIRFWRHQFTNAMRQADMRKGREIFDSLQTDSDDVYDVTIEECEAPSGRWYHPTSPESTATVLYFHGGGYTFNGPVSERFAAMFTHHTKAHLYAANYRLTPEHPHPAQAEDALAAWRYVTSIVPAEKIVVMGDSAGGHMALMLLQTLKREGLPQPALCIGLCPWTDIGERNDSLHSNDYYDLVQGWMALQFGEWLDGGGKFGREVLSPIFYDYRGLAPLYLQAGGREIMRDMVRDFAETQAANKAKIMLDVWEGMPHNFQAYGSLNASATHALCRIRVAIEAHVGENKIAMPQETVTVIASEAFMSTFRAL